MANRFVSLDVLRGVAILGTLGTNIWIFTDTEGLVGYLRGEEATTGAGAAIEAVLQQITQGKFLGLLTIMFGIGLAIQQRSAARRGRPWPGKYYWRAILLFVDGTVNYFLFAEFDVLMGYAVTGLIVAYLLAMTSKHRCRALIVSAGIHATLLAIVVAALASYPAPTGNARPLSPNPYADGSFLDLIAFRAAHAGLFRAEVIFILPMSIALFLTGAALLRAGILEPRGAELRRRLLVIGFGIALPLDLVVGIFGGDAGLVLGRYGTAPFVAFGLLALIAGFYADGRPAGRIGGVLAPIGRMALSCYVIQNAIAGAICYGWGFGLAHRLDGDTLVPATVALFIALTVFLAVFTRLWLSRFERGPLEWLWHRGYDLLAGERRPVAAGTDS